MIDILLATCNSGPFLAQQLDSIMNQNVSEAFRIIIRDDGSSDGTSAIVANYADRHPEQIVVLDNAGRGEGAVANFARLLEAAEAELVMFADHDDVWMPDKIHVSLEKYRELAAVHGAQTPILVFSDVVVTDEMLQPVARSGFRYQHIDPSRLALRQLLLQNVPSGNTLLLNRALRKLAAPIPPAAVMHDHWLTLTATVFGQIGRVAQPTLFYRQHGTNVYGAADYSLSFFLRQLLSGRGKIIERFDRNVAQAEAFLARYREQLPAETIPMLEEFSRFRQLNFWERRRCLTRHGIWKSGLWRNLGMLLLC